MFGPWLDPHLLAFFQFISDIFIKPHKRALSMRHNCECTVTRCPCGAAPLRYKKPEVGGGGSGVSKLGPSVQMFFRHVQHPSREVDSIMKKRGTIKLSFLFGPRFDSNLMVVLCSVSSSTSDGRTQDDRFFFCFLRCGVFAISTKLTVTRASRTCCRLNDTVEEMGVSPSPAYISEPRFQQFALGKIGESPAPLPYAHMRYSWTIPSSPIADYAHHSHSGLVWCRLLNAFQTPLFDGDTGMADLQGL